MERRTSDLLLAALALSGLIYVAGCDRKPVPSAPPVPSALPPTAAVAEVVVAAPVTRAETSQPTTAPAAPTPAVSQLSVRQVFKEFPEAKIRFVTSDDHVTAILFSADPPTAINDDYAGNSFYLTMPLNDVKDLSGIDGAQWRFKSISSEHVDNTDGIFLEGLRHHLEPMDVIVRLEGTGSKIHIRMAGEFLDFDSTMPHQPGSLTPVSGELEATIDTQKSKP